MTYLAFLGYFIVFPIFFLGILFFKSKDPNKKFFLNGIIILCTLAFIWTTPWDNYLVANNIWGYGEDRIMGTIGYVPIEEYCFFFLQTIMTGLYTFFIVHFFPIKKVESKRHPITFYFVLILAFLTGVLALFQTTSTYLGLILVWAIPICLLQWSIGGKYLSSNLKTYALCTLPPTIYLWLADHYAISNGIWYISEETILGLKVGSLPLEEATFFLVTNMMVTQGLILFVAMRERLPEYRMRIKRLFFAV